MVVFVGEVNYINYLAQPGIVFDDLRMDILNTLGLPYSNLENIVIERVVDADNQFYPIILKTGTVTNFHDLKGSLQIDLSSYYTYQFMNNLDYTFTISNPDRRIQVIQDAVTPNILYLRSNQIQLEYEIHVVVKDRYTGEDNSLLTLSIKESTVTITPDIKNNTTYFNIVNQTLSIQLLDYFDDYIYKEYLSFSFDVVVTADDIDETVKTDIENNVVSLVDFTTIQVVPDYRGTTYSIRITTTDDVYNITNNTLVIDIEEDGAVPILIDNSLTTVFNNSVQNLNK